MVTQALRVIYSHSTPALDATSSAPDVLNVYDVSEFNVLLPAPLRDR